MKILHYSLGFPPYRSGGLTKFAMDLMTEQLRRGHQVSLLWPGTMTLFGGKTTVRRGKLCRGIESFEIINPLPVSYDEGITRIGRFTAACDPRGYREFLERLRPDVIHIHTFMGLHREFLEAAKERRIRIVFSVHDFFAACPKVTLFRDGGVCPDPESCESCPGCNGTALSTKKIFLLQSPLYRAMKDNPLVKRLRKRHRDQFLRETGEGEPAAPAGIRTSPEEYLRLRSYYGQMLEAVEMVHYNSGTTKAVFERFFQPERSVVLPIAHGDIKDHRRKKDFTEHLRLTYLGPQGGAKGYFLLIQALDALWETDRNFELNIYFSPSEEKPYLRPHPRYSYSQLEEIMEGTDLLLVPSVWYETFGYTVPEALAYGVPVCISGRVGARDIVPPGGGILLENMTWESLAEALKDLDPQRLQGMNGAILSGDAAPGLSWMAGELERLCYRQGPEQKQ